MMVINFRSQIRKGALEVSRTGDALNINGTDFDLSVIPEGATLPASAVDSLYFQDVIERINGVLHVTLLLPIGLDASQAARFPEPITVISNGPIGLPK